MWTPDIFVSVVPWVAFDGPFELAGRLGAFVSQSCTILFSRPDDVGRGKKYVSGEFGVSHQDIL